MEREKIHLITDFIDIKEAEVEDFVDTGILASIVNRFFRGRDEFLDIYNNKEAIVPQIKKYVSDQKLSLENGWKVEIAREYKKKTQNDRVLEGIVDSTIEKWKQLFEKWISNT